jgi:TolB protein
VRGAAASVQEGFMTVRHLGRSGRRSSTTRPYSFLLLAGVVLAACGDGTGPVAEVLEELLFVGSREAPQGSGGASEHRDIFRIREDGTGVENVTRTPAEHYRSLGLTRDGRTVVFNRQSGCYGIFTMGTDGSNVREIADFENFRCTYRPRIAANSAQVAFTTSRDRLGWGVWAMNLDGSGARKVSGDLELTGGVWAGGWSPDGRVVLHHTLAIGQTRTYLAAADGSGVTPMFDRVGDHSPAWSPDGSRIAFISDRDGAQRVYVMNADGSGVRRVSSLGGEDFLAHPWSIAENDHSPWSPDGRSLVFTNVQGNLSSLYIVAPDGSGLRRLTDPQLNAAFNGWSRSGGRIAFSGSAGALNSPRDIFIVNADGTGQRNVTSSSSNDGNALWLPRR